MNGVVGEIVRSQEDWDRIFYGMAQYVAHEFSKDPRRKVGAVLVSADRKQQSIGYNGFPTGTPDTKQHLMDEAVRQRLMVHAEVNAVMNATFGRAGTTLYSTKFPCNVCAGVIANYGVQRLVAPRPNFNSSTWGLAYKAAVHIIQARNIEVSYVMEPTSSPD